MAVKYSLSYKDVPVEIVDQILPPRRAYGRNVNASNANVVSPAPDYEVSNAEFQNAIQLLAQSVTNKITNRLAKRKTWQKLCDGCALRSRYGPHCMLKNYSKSQLVLIISLKVNLRTIFHPQTDGQVERTIQTLEDMLRVCVINFKGSWDDHLPFIEFAYNNSYHCSIQMASYEALMGVDADLMLVGLKIGKVAYELELPAELVAVHPVFHVSLLKKCVGDPAYVVPLESMVVKDSLSYKDVPVEILDQILRPCRAYGRNVNACNANVVSPAPY
ncbi:hypothetical protein MTR67_052256 [Solanum verrucosum]|uniref:Tf2-1-like SH3-like domain-containing protein n=1 Tax=Solanum verrucosum TaxID=315347 RepID=A0AAF0V902_SOLVR|nr:hypothetical protein MTR67_052256 [Solanum verrucosum]